MNYDEQEIVWRDRYYELERTLEQVIRQVGKPMNSSREGNQAEFGLRKVVTHEFVGAPHIICVANGENLEYAFDFMRDGEVVESINFQRSNTVPVALGQRLGANECFVKVKTNAPGFRGQIQTKRVAI